MGSPVIIARVDIRGVIASASLKLFLHARLSRAQIYIRGVIASASLKQKPVMSKLLFVQKYPRRYRLGLIEASRSSVLSERSRSYPRRYRLGLIEAPARSTPNPSPR